MSLNMCCIGKKDNRIKVIHKENSGVSETRNCGLAMTTGEFIGFGDSDDYIYNVNMKKQMYYTNLFNIVGEIYDKRKII